MSVAVSALKELLGGVPLSDEQQQKAAQLIQKCTSQELQSLGLNAPVRPAVPKNLEKLPIRERLSAIQKVISSIEYNHSPGYFYNVSKDRPFSRVMDTAREVLREALPIKCIEAVFLGTLLTAGWEGLARMPMGFKSRVNGETYRHIVLVVHHSPTQKWGALGISRRDELMYKDLVFDSLSDLVADFKAGYERWWHKLQKARIGLPFDHDVYSNASVCWRYCTVSPTKHSWSLCASSLDKFADDYRVLLSRFKVLGFAPVPLRNQGPDAASTLPPRAPASGSAAAAQHKSVSPTKRRPQAAPVLLSPSLPPPRPAVEGKSTKLPSSSIKQEAVSADKPGSDTAVGAQAAENGPTSGSNCEAASRGPDLIHDDEDVTAGGQVDVQRASTCALNALGAQVEDSDDEESDEDYNS